MLENRVTSNLMKLIETDNLEAKEVIIRDLKKDYGALKAEYELSESTKDLIRINKLIRLANNMLINNQMKQAHEVNDEDI